VVLDAGFGVNRARHRLVGERRQVVSDFKDLFGDWRPDDEGRNSREGLPESEGRNGPRPLREKEVKVVNVYEAEMGTQQPSTFVLLRDNSGREFKIFVLRDVAFAIHLALQDAIPDRPFTHDLMKTMLERLGATVERITIDDLWQDTFYAKISLVKDGATMDIDARPSDALAVALRFHAPIYVAESVLEAAQLDF
jgi:bifunctional DNase/RNase